MPKITSQNVLMAGVFLLAFGYLVLQSNTNSGAVTVGISGLPFSIWNGVEKGNTATFNVTLTNTGNVPANFSIASVTGNSAEVLAFASALSSSIANKPVQLSENQTYKWTSVPLDITGIPTGSYQLAFNITGTNPSVETVSQVFYYDFDVSQVKIVILSDTSFWEYVGGGNCNRNVQHGRILSVEVRTPTTVHFTMFGSTGSPCLTGSHTNEQNCVAKCADQNCYYAGLTNKVCEFEGYTPTVNYPMSSSGYYLIYRMTYPPMYFGELFSYTWSND